MLLYLSALVSLAAKQLRKLKELSPTTVMAMVVVIGYFASSLFGNTMFNTSLYFWMMLGFAACAPPGSFLFGAASDARAADSAAEASTPSALRVCLAVLAVVGTFFVIAFGFTL